MTVAEAEQQEKRGWRPPATLVRATVSVLCIAATVYWLAHQPKPELPSGTQWGFVVIAAAATMITALMRGWRWARILHSAHADHLGTEPYQLTAVGYMGNTVLPARGGDVLRVTLLARERKVDWKTGTGTLIPERLLDLGAIAVLLIVLTVLSAGTEKLGIWPAVAAAGFILASAVALGGYEYLRRKGRLERVADVIRPFSRPTRLLWHRDVGPIVVALSFGIWLVEAAIFWLVVRATHEAIPFTSAALVIVLVSVASAVPAAPGFLGTFDAAVLFGLTAAGVPSALALSTAVLYRLVVFVPITLVGAGLLVTRYGGLRTLRIGSRRSQNEPAADVVDSADAA